MRSFYRSQLRKTVNRNRNKRKTRRNKRTKNARGGGLVNGQYIPDRNYIYEGQINREREPHGKGKMTYKDKQGRDIICEGEWQSGKMHGLGKMQFYSDRHNTIVTTEGFWENDTVAKGPYKKTLKTGGVWIGRLLDNGISEGDWFGETVENTEDCNKQTCFERKKCANLGTVTYHDKNTKYYVYPNRDLCDLDKGLLTPLALSNAVYAEKQYESARTSQDRSESAMKGFENTKNMQNKRYWETVKSLQK